VADKKGTASLKRNLKGLNHRDKLALARETQHEQEMSGDFRAKSSIAEVRPMEIAGLFNTLFWH